MGIPSISTAIYENSPRLDIEAVRARQEAWNAGEPVSSTGLVAVGRVALEAADAELLDGLRPFQYQLIDGRKLSAINATEKFKSTPRLGALFAAYVSIVQWDLGRSSVPASPTIFMLAPDTQIDLGWHVDPTARPYVRHVLSVGGRTSTRGAIGTFKISDVDRQSGDIRRGVAVTSQAEFDQGTVLRITSADVHAGPARPRKRIFMRTHVDL